MFNNIKNFLGSIHYALHVKEHMMFNYLLPAEKRAYLGGFSTDYNVFIETGTYLGKTTAAMSSLYGKVHTIEIDEKLYEDACGKLADFKNIACHHGDSALVLEEILQNLDEPAVFWLDAHYSMGKTGRAEGYDTPIERELAAIFNHDPKRHVILIDDARLFVGRHQYPSITKLWKFVRKHSNHGLTIKDDIIRLCYDSEWGN